MPDHGVEQKSSTSSISTSSVSYVHMFCGADVHSSVGVSTSIMEETRRTSDGRCHKGWRYIVGKWRVMRVTE